MKIQKRFFEISDEGVFCLVCTSDSYVHDVYAIIRLLAKKYPEELAQVCARPNSESAEAWVEMMAKRRCPGIDAGYVPVTSRASEGAEQR